MPAIPSTVVSVIRSPEVANTLFWNFIQTRGKNPDGRTPDRIRNDIISYDTKVRQLYQELAAAESFNSEDLRDTAYMNFNIAREELMNNSTIVDMFIANSHLYIQYKDIECYVKEFETTYDLGSFLVDFDMANAIFRIYSLKYFICRTAVKEATQKSVDEYVAKGVYPVGYVSGIIPHPHVRSFDPCMGNIGNLLAPLVAKYQFGTLIELLTAYMQNANMQDGWGCIAPAWPVKSGPGIQEWSKEIYKKVSKEDHAKYARAATGSGWTNKYFTWVEVDPEAMLKCVMNLPKDRRTVAELTAKEAEQIVEEEVAENIAEEIVVDAEGYPMYARDLEEAPVKKTKARTKKKIVNGS